MNSNLAMSESEGCIFQQGTQRPKDRLEWLARGLCIFMLSASTRSGALTPVFHRPGLGILQNNVLSDGYHLSTNGSVCRKSFELPFVSLSKLIPK